jgi:hypothetical protein
VSPYSTPTWPQPDSTSAPSRPKRRWKLVTAGTAIALVCALVIATVAIAVQDDGNESASDTPSLSEQDRGSRASRTPLKPPPVWDDEVLPLVEFVEETRGSTFEEAVTIVFVTQDEWSERGLDVYTNGLGSLSSSNLGYFRSLGLVDNSIQPYQLSSPTIEGVLGYYDSQQQEITVIGDGYDPLTEVIIVHELTHALQDQTVGVSEYVGGFAGYDFMSVATVESDAAWVQRQYENQLSDQEYAAFAAAYETRIAAIVGRVGDQPGLEALKTFSQSPYLVGPGFIEQVRQADGVDGVDDFIGSVPQQDEFLFDASGYLSGEEEQDTPRISTPEPELWFEDFGALYTMVVLSSRISPEQAHSAGDGFAGGQLQQYENADGKACTQLVLIGDDDAATQLLLDAFTQWSALMPDATTETQRGAIVVRSCDVGEPTSAATPSPSPNPQTILLARLALVSDLEAAGSSPSAARCIAKSMTDQFGDATIEKVSSSRRELQAAIDDVVASNVCR